MKAIAVIVTILAVPVVAFIWFASAITNVNADDYGVGKILIAVVIVLVAGLWWFALRKPIVESPPKPPKAVTGKPATPKFNPKFPQIKDFTSEPTYGIFQMPCDCYRTQGFTASHFGIDYQRKGGSAIFAAEAGTVVRSDYGWNGGYGNVVVIDHGNGVQTLYAHNKENLVKVGEIVEKGGVIATMGGTGNASGPHLHFEIRKDRNPRNPLFFLP